ncbi:MAG: NADH:ubiquinone reductase (Na(+)-transporting) subunit B [Rhodothermales bacterium]|nr:NADH:ubiquinone reductase (Na(+)-transporting) subunit B [Rhodothermales bacterium]
MKLFENLLGKVKPHFAKGGKLEKYYYGFDALETFLFVPGHASDPGGTHIKDGIDLKRTMFTVVIAMVPCLLFGIWNVGHQHFLALGEFIGAGEGFMDKILYGAIKVLPIVIVSYGVGLGIEFGIAIAKKHPVNEGFLVSGMLIPLVMPPTIPLWMVALATAFAVLLGKEAFGGTGMNILNVALTARVFLFFAYPIYMSGDAVWIAGDPALFVDGFSGATPLGVAYLDGMAGLASMQHVSYDLSSLILGTIPGSIGETSFIAIGIGAVILLVTGIASWRIMASMMAGAYVTAVVFAVTGIDPFLGVPPHYHLFMGSLLFAAVFMATDPVTAAQTTRGKFIYGFLIGIFGMIIRVLNPAYPEGWMLAILLMNVFAPTIDHLVVQSNIKRRLSRALK